MPQPQRSLDCRLIAQLAPAIVRTASTRARRGDRVPGGEPSLVPKLLDGGGQGGRRCGTPRLGAGTGDRIAANGVHRRGARVRTFTLVRGRAPLGPHGYFEGFSANGASP